MGTFDFDSLPRPTGYRRTYAGTLETYRRGLLSEGLISELVARDEVFAAFLRRASLSNQEE